MISIKVQTVMAAAEKYMEDHLSQGEFASEGEERSPRGASDSAELLTKYYNDLPMRWHGGLVKKIGFDPVKPITQKQFKALLENKNPIIGRNLTARTVKGRRLYFDAATSAPKSVSILAVTMGDHRLIKAHEAATAFVISEIEKYAQTRVRVDNQDTVRKTGNVLCSSVTHTTSRANDPQLHSHNLFFNVTWDNVEHKFKALEAFQIYDKANYFTDIYRHTLAQKVQELGYKIEHQRNGWEIKGVTPEICEKFSKRSKAIKQIVANMENDLGRTATNKEKALVTEKTRRAKSKNLTLKEAIELQRSELSKEQLKSLELVIKQAKLEKNLNDTSTIKLVKNPSKVNTEFETKADIDAFNFAVKHIFERQSVVSKQDLISAAIKYNYGKFNLAITDKLIDANQGLFRGDNDKIGTLKGLAHELYISQFVDQTKDKFTAKIVKPDFNTASFNPEQLNAFNSILASKNQVHFLEGAAGTGKSFLLSGLCEVIAKNKLPILTTAPTAAATQLLEKDMKMPAQTLQSVLINHDLFKEHLTNGYLIVDEAGFISSEQMDNLFKIADKYNTQLLLVGDTKQHHGVEAGDALRALKIYSKLECSQLTTIIRQKNISYKNAVIEIQRQNFKKGWEQFKQMGCVHSADDKLKGKSKESITSKDLEAKLDYERIVKTYTNKKAQGKSVLVIAPTRTEVQKITDYIRANNPDLDQNNKISKEVFSSARFTEAEKNNLNSYVTNPVDPHYVIFHQKEGPFKNNSLWKIVAKDDFNLTLKNEKTNEVKLFNPVKYNVKSMDILNKKTIEVQKGDEITLQKNSKSQNITNGEIVRVKDFSEKGMELLDGRIINPDYSFFDYGYATTSYSSQGKTCDHVILAMSNTGGKAISAQQFYVSTSRGREGIDIFVESEEYIQSRIESFGARTLNRELLISSKTQALNTLKEKSLQELQEALQKMALPRLEKIPTGTIQPTLQTQPKKPWVTRQKEAFYKTADKYIAKIKDLQVKSFEQFNNHSKFKSKELTPDKAISKSIDLDI